MERIKPRRHLRSVFLAPAGRGWRLRAASNEAGSRVFATLDEAAAAIPAEHLVHLALPTQTVLIERMRLPATDRAEIASMMALQLEKTLPFSVDEVASGMELVTQTKTESVILAFAVNVEQLNALCEPLRRRFFLPEKITPFALHVARGGAAGESEAVIFLEDEQVVFAICEGAKLSYAHSAPVSGPEDFFAELPQLLLSAELDGVPVALARVRLDQGIAGWEAKAREFFGVPTLVFPTDAPAAELEVNLVPGQWRRERSKIASASRLRGRAIKAAAIYVVLLLVAAGTIFWFQNELGKIDRQLRVTRPQIDAIAARKAKWLALAPALEPSRYPVEVLMQICSSLPSDAIRLTLFDQILTQFTVEAEAPSAAAAVEYGERLKKNPGLADFKFEIGPPTILPNEHAKVRIVGKL